MSDKLATDFAPAERAAKTETQADYVLIDKDLTMVRILQCFPNIVLILNEYRQIVFFNNALLLALGLEDGKNVLGLRPGELLGCTHASESAGGCGTTEACAFCGAVLAILAGLDGKSETRECRITTSHEGKTEALDLSVHAAYTEIEGKKFVFFSLVDISSEKRRQALERIFFHDVLNTASAINSTIQLLSSGTDPESQKELIGLLPIVSKKLINEVKSQQDLLKAERGELHVNSNPLSTLRVLRDLVAEYKHSLIFEGKDLEIATDSVDIQITTDETLLKRVLSNMLKNAIEASTESDSIQVGNRLFADNKIVFYVRNKHVMTDEIRLQVFNRSFSTKGVGRGLGTYSMKLLTEQYLNGNISFHSDAAGTVFEVELPIS